MMSRHLLLLLTAVLTISPTLLSEGRAQDVPVKLITIRATVKDSAGRPIQGSSIVVTDAHHVIVDAPDLVARFTGYKGQVLVHFPASASFYSVRAYARTYLPSSVRTIPASRDSTLTFILNKKPRDSGRHRRGK